jgi:hypothetical protein
MVDFTTIQRMAEARRLQASGARTREIAKAIGVAVSTAHKYVDPNYVPQPNGRPPVARARKQAARVARDRKQARKLEEDAMALGVDPGAWGDYLRKCADAARDDVWGRVTYREPADHWGIDGLPSRARRAPAAE